MGGNVIGLLKTGQQTMAEKVPLKLIGRQNFIQTVEKTLKAINKGFKNMHGYKIWEDESQIDDAYVFNGSTSFVMDNRYNDDDIIPYKSSVGDIDLTIPEDYRQQLWEYLDSVEDKVIIPGVVYKGSNRPQYTPNMTQINSVFAMQFGDRVVNVQMDFEFVPFENGRASAWAKFAHSSSYEDALVGVKAVAHKYLLRALVGAASVNNDIVIATSKSTYDNVTLSKSKTHINPRMLKFSVDKGLRVAYEPLLDPNGNIVQYEGKSVFKEIPTSVSNFITDLPKIYKLVFNRARANSADVAKMNSFISLLKLCKKRLSKDLLEKTHDRFIELLWADKPMRAQELESGNPELDREIKEKAYYTLIKEFGLKDQSEALKDEYYKSYRAPREITESYYFTHESNYAHESKFISFLEYLKRDV